MRLATYLTISVQTSSVLRLWLLRVPHIVSFARRQWSYLLATWSLAYLLFYVFAYRPFAHLPRAYPPLHIPNPMSTHTPTPMIMHMHMPTHIYIHLHMHMST